MSDEPNGPGRSSTGRLIAALDVPRNAAIGFGTGVLIAAGAYLYRVLGVAGPVPGSRGSPALFLLLAFVLAISIGALLTTALTVWSAVRLARAAEEPGTDRVE